MIQASKQWHNDKNCTIVLSNWGFFIIIIIIISFFLNNLKSVANFLIAKYFQITLRMI